MFTAQGLHAIEMAVVQFAQVHLVIIIASIILLVYNPAQMVVNLTSCYSNQLWSFQIVQ